ncbi:AMP-binding protein [Pseudalgibacter alginicilyticus]|uniref:AMP-binding protein n=1 Tax=Pseudalgibacter alginicilyticus TaxID=1736674 RepID=A0A0P0D637_9FLAO|nr:phenylacetate--CoA ligase family protein [Pseudalgibacter alginicilyticus]ALJ05568.1 AMP-binding protein [Pseudalgibacter alginicilyticus]
MKLFNLSLQFNGFPLKKGQSILNDIHRKSNNEFTEYLNIRKKDIVSHHLKHNSFYKTFAKNANLNNWNTIPIMTKDHLQQPLEKRLSEGYNEKNVYINKTSGSSGNPFIFAKDRLCHALTWSVFINRYSWFNIDLNTSKQARFYGIPLNKKNYYKERFKDFLSNRYRFSVFDLSDTQLEKNLIKFKTSKFEYINGYTSSIVQFTKFLKQKNIVLKTICPSLKGCIVTSEMLFKEDRQLIETQFGIPIINEYGAAELGLIAFQNTNNEWIINNEDLYVEILDDSNNILPYGEEGKIVITSLYNKAHPFIRYELGDIGILSKNSTIEKPILEKLIGRTNDIVVLPSGKKAAGLSFYYVTKTIIENNTPVKEFIVEQVKLDTFKITYVSHYELSKEKLKAISKAIDNYLEPNLHIIFKREDQLIRSERGKLKQFTSHL